MKSRPQELFAAKILQILLLRVGEIGALNPNSVVCTDQARSTAFSALNPRTLNPGSTVLSSIWGTAPDRKRM